MLKQRNGAFHFKESKIIEQEKVLIDCYNTPNQKTGFFRMFLKIYKGHYFKLFMSMLFYIIKDSPTWVIPIVIAKMIDIAASGTDNFLRDSAGYMIFCAVLLIINIPLHYMHIKLMSLARRNVEAGLRGAMITKLQQLSISFHRSMHSGRIQSKVIRDVEAVEILTMQVFTTLIGMVVNMIISISVIILSNLIVFGFFVICVPIAALIMMAFRKSMRECNHELRAEIEHASADVAEMVELIPVTRAHALERKEIERMSSLLKTVAEKGYRVDIIQSLFGSTSWVVFQLFQILCLFTSCFMAINGWITLGAITLYQTYFTRIVNQVSSIVSLLPTLTKGAESLRSIGEILSAHDVEDYSNKKKISNLRGEYELKDVCFEYDGRKPVIKDLNIKVEQGETVALVGASGSGKSTVINMLIGFYKPNSGVITVDGENMSNLDLRSYRKHIAVVPQSSVLFTGSIRDNITYGLSGVTDEQLNTAIKAANLEEYIKSAPDGLDTNVGEHGNNLSGGQRQRVSIARAIIRNPQVIILDEATSALDTVSEKEIQEAISNLTENHTTFIVAHRLSTIRDADKIAVLKEGRCVEFGTFEELMDLKGEFYKLEKTQLQSA